VNEALVPVERPLEDADKLNVPSVPSVILHPANVATPEDAVTGFVVQARVPDPDAIASVTAAALVVTTLPPASSILATGWVAKAVALVEFDGCAVKTTFVAVPTVTLNALDVVAESPPSVAASL
jgi:hypothetical protein